MTDARGRIGSLAPLSGRWPLSLAQEQLLFVREVSEADNGYLFPVNVRLRGRLDVAALMQAVQQLVQRHAVLRSRVVQVEGAFFQEASAEPFTLTVEDLRHLQAQSALEAAERRVHEEAEQPFDLGESWLRGRLLRLADDDQVLLLSFHHIAFDGWSLGVLTRELNHLYDSALSGRAPQLDPLPAQVGDIAGRERRLIADHGLAKEEEFWAAQLTPRAPDLALPTDRPRPELLSGKAGRVSLRLGTELTSALDRVAREQRCTLHMVLLAAFEATLWRASGQTDFCVGGATSGRHDPNAHGLIGLFVNDIAYRSDCAVGQTFTELLSGVKKTALDAYRHQTLPLQRIVEVVRPPRQANRHPLFQHSLVLQPSTVEDKGFQLPGVRAEPFRTLAEGSALDLAVSLHHEADGLHCVADFSTDLWDEDSVGRLIENFRRVLVAMTTGIQAKVEDLDLIDAWVRDPVASADEPAGTEASDPQPAPDPDRLERLRLVWRELLGRDVGDEDNFFDLGGDSILALHLVNHARARGVQIRVRDLFAHQTLRALAARTLAAAARPEASIRTGGSAHPRPTGTVPLLPIQSWFFAQQRTNTHYNFTSLYRPPSPLDEHAMGRAVAITLKHHDASRIRFRTTDDGTIEQYYLDGPGHQLMTVQDLSDRQEPEAARRDLEAIALDVQRSLEILGTGPLIRCVLFRMPGGGSRLLIAASHLVMDVASMQVVAEDIATAYRSLVERSPVRLLPGTASVQQWAEALHRHGSEDSAPAADIPYWQDVENRFPSGYPADHPGAPNFVRHQETRAFRLPPDVVRPLRQVLPGLPGQSLLIALMAAAGWALGTRIGSRGIVIDLEGHGREDLFADADPSRTVGWLTSIYPFALPTGAALEGRAALAALAEQYQRLPDNGMSYGALASAGRGLTWRDRSVAFSFMGSMSSAASSESEFFTFDAVAPEGARHPDLSRRHELEIDAFVVDDVLKISLTYGTQLYDEATIVGLGEACLDFLRNLSRS
ncbi:hypothetical protein KMT30_06570 [Streptomyces sp. IBSBF 2953]|nr:hypothetical protein [Streptomyces hayashii]